MKWLLKPVYTVDGIVNVFLRSNITLLLLTVIILIHLLYFTIQENWFYVLLLIMMTFVFNYIFSTGTLGLLLTLLTAYIVMIVRNDGFPDFFQDDEYLEGFRRRRRKRPKRRRFKKPKVKMPKVKNVVKSTIKIAEKNNLKRKAVNMLKKYGKYTPQGQVLLLMMRKDKERRKKLREERRRRAEERRKREEERRKREEEERRRRDQAARDTVFRQQTKDAFDKTNYEINRQQIEFQIQERERIRRERINKDLSENIPEHAIVRSNETKEFINGTQVFW
jgi:hypothetical protein